jgi:pterin-4a-carbinolamine dehydratase
LTAAELESALDNLGNWDISYSDIPGNEPNKRTELHRIFDFASFEDAISFMGQAAPHISKLDHHPRWENVWCTVIVSLCTWDIAHKPSELDLEVASYLENLRRAFPPSKPRKSRER